METIKLALRSAKRNKRRSALTIVSIVLGVSVLMNMQGMLRGLTSTVYGHMMDMDTAQVQVEAAAYRADARRLPLDQTIPDPEALAATLKAVPGVAAVSIRVDAAFEVSNGVSAVRVMARCVAPEEAAVTGLERALVSGRLPGRGEEGLVIGSGLARKLGLAPGDPVFYTALDKRSARNLGAATVLGIFEYGYPLMDDFVVFSDLERGQSFLGLGSEATRLVLRGERSGASAALARRVQAALADRGDLAVYEWKTFAENLVSTVETRIKLLGGILLMLFALIGAGIFNAMAMNVQERGREIGTLRAIGMRRSRLERLFLAEGLLLGVAGCAVAALPSTLLGLLLGLVGIDVSAFMPRDVPIPFGTRMYAVYALGDVLRAIGAALGAATLGSLLPALRASRLPITQSLGSVR